MKTIFYVVDNFEKDQVKEVKENKHIILNVGDTVYFKKHLDTKIVDKEYFFDKDEYHYTCRTF